MDSNTKVKILTPADLHGGGIEPEEVDVQDYVYALSKRLGEAQQLIAYLRQRVGTLHQEIEMLNESHSGLHSRLLVLEEKVLGREQGK